jgi:hypothetical protein
MSRSPNRQISRCRGCRSSSHNYENIPGNRRRKSRRLRGTGRARSGSATRLAGSGALVADFCTLLAAVLTAFAARLGASQADLFAQFAGVGMQRRSCFTELRTAHAHVMAGQAHPRTFGLVVLATGTTGLARIRTFQTRFHARFIGTFRLWFIGGLGMPQHRRGD